MVEDSINANVFIITLIIFSRVQLIFYSTNLSLLLLLEYS